MPLFRKKDKGPELSLDGSNELAVRAREVVNGDSRERAANVAGGFALESYSDDGLPPDIVGELSPDYLKFMQEELYTTKGKFVKIGDLFLVAPAVYGRPGSLQQGVGHETMLALFAHREPELQRKLADAQNVVNVRGTAAEYLPNKRNSEGVEDAGYFMVDPTDSTIFKIGGKSGTYERADAEGRKATITLAQKLLGAGVRVEEEDAI